MIFLPLLAAWTSLRPQDAQSPEVGAWVALPTPILCEPRAAEALPSPLSNGSHLSRPSDGPSARASAPTPRVQLATFLKILEEPAAGARLGRIEFFKSSASILARGDPAALEAARQRIAEFDRAAEALAIELEVDLSGASAAGGSSTAPEHWTQKRRVFSGDEAFFGERHTTGFLMSFDVEVAADSGIASPVLGTASYGHTLHVRAARVDGGRKVRLEGLLDLSELTSLDRFDPETPDLGVIQEPSIDCVQVAFAGVVDSGGVLEVRISGAQLARSEWKLTVKAVAHPDDSPAQASGDAKGKTSFLDVLDLACLASDAAPLPAVLPGADLDRLAAFLPPARGPVAIPPSAIAAALDSRSSENSAGRIATWWGDDLLILRRADAAARAEARSLVAAGEAARLATYRIEARQGGLTASFPACAGSPARLLAGREHTALVGYRVEIAPQTWMAAPEVQKLYDGLELSAQVLPGAAECSLWISRSAPPQVVVRGDAQLGKLQVLSRSLRTDRARILAGEAGRELAAQTTQGGPADAVVLRCLAP